MDTVRYDKDRERRTGVTEAILAGPKDDSSLVDAVRSALRTQDRALLTKIGGNQLEMLRKKFKTITVRSSTVLVGVKPESWSDQVGIFAGGTSDLKVVDEVVMTLHAHGVDPHVWVDIGVADIRRIQQALQEADQYGVKIIIAVAGMEGALFSVVGGLTDKLVIAVPTSVGYGYGGGGETALKSAVQSCSPGVVVVNIDNGFGAASAAIKVLRSFRS